MTQTITADELVRRVLEESGTHLTLAGALKVCIAYRALERQLERGVEGLADRWRMDADYLRRHAKDSEWQQKVLLKCADELEAAITNAASKATK